MTKRSTGNAAEVTEVHGMTKREAQACITRIRSSIEGVRQQVLALYEGKGWEALGYRSWRECVTAEFPQSEMHLYRTLKAAQVERNLTNWLNEPVQITESQARELAKLKESNQQIEAWEKASETAPNGALTAKHIANVVAELLPEKTRREPRAPKSRGAVTADDVTKAREAIESIPPKRWSCPECEASFEILRVTWDPNGLCPHCVDPDEDTEVAPPESERRASVAPPGEDHEEDEERWNADVSAMELDSLIQEFVQDWPNEESVFPLIGVINAWKQRLERLENKRRGAA